MKIEKKRDLKGFKCMTVSLDFPRLFEIFRYFLRFWDFLRLLDELLHGKDEILHGKDEIFHGKDEILQGKDEILHRKDEVLWIRWVLHGYYEE